MWPYKKKNCQSEAVKKIEKCTGCDKVFKNESECNRIIDGSCLCQECAIAKTANK